jgi:four helix bundle protein
MFTFENLEVYKKAFAQNQKVYRLLEKDTSLPRYMKDQLGRASLSIQLNIAEGSGRFAKRDRRNFFVVARSSALECASLDTVSICGR